MTVDGAEDDDREIFSCKTEDGNWNDAKNIERFDVAKKIGRSQVGKAEFLGRAVAKPKVFLQEDLASVLNKQKSNMTNIKEGGSGQFFLVPFSFINIMWIHPRKLSYRRIFTKTWSCYHQSLSS